MRLIYRVAFSASFESRYAAAKQLYSKLPLSLRHKEKIRYFLMHKLRIQYSRNRAAAHSLGAGVNIEYELTGSPEARKKLTRLPVDENWIFVANPSIPEPDKSSGSLRLFTILMILKSYGFNIVFATLRNQDQVVEECGGEDEFNSIQSKMYRLCDEVIYGHELIGAHLVENGYKYRFSYLSFPDVCYELMPIIYAYCIHAKVIYDTIDLHSLRFRREADLTHDKFLYDMANYYRAIEGACADMADTVIAITENEREQITKLSPDSNVEIIPNIHTVASSVSPFSGRKNLLFIGHFKHTPNQDAVIYFVEKILPLVRSVLPDVVFTIIGSSVTNEVKKLKSAHVDIVGYVEDIEPYFNSHRVFVAPLRFGAGMKGKVGQSMSLGLPLVTTTIGAEGMGIENRKHVLIADSEQAFADAVIMLYQNESLWTSLSERALTFIARNYSRLAVEQSLYNIFSVGTDDN